ncbi:hypothetical protein HJG60_011456 [Phyllostomus discolor]|uniref:DDE-1 domain-containing protein n=1 Tax=Phyllostomus discolor TaxID=89673 RepID=A0A833ZTM3_9CHIR|nr:hypothetical protein HJG60_011456 [Phyllostomus discolor]
MNELAPKLLATCENPVFAISFLILSVFKRLTTLSYPKLPICMRSHSHLMCHLTELWTSKEQRPLLLKLVVIRKHFTVLVCCADGTKLPPMIIIKRKMFPKQKIASRVIVHVHEKGWMNEQGMKIWFNKVWS